MSYRRLAEALLQGRPYLGPCLRSLQGPPDRHRCFLPVVKSVAERAPLEILEVGSCAGASAISWASALKKLGLGGHVTCVDPWLPYFDSEKETGRHYDNMNRAAKSGLIYQLFRHNVSSSGFGKTILAKRGKSCAILPKLQAQSFDIVYLDGSHVLEDVLFDLREAKRLIRSGGIVCGDDLELQLHERNLADVGAAAGTGKDYIPAGANGLCYHPGVTLAVGTELGPVGVWDGFWAIQRSGEQWIPVPLDMSRSTLPRHVASAVIRQEGEMPGYHLISSGRRYFGLAKDLGPLDIAIEMLQEDDLPPLIFSGATLEEVRQKIDRSLGMLTVKMVKDRDLDLYPTPVLVGSHRGFNLVRFKTDCYGLRQSLGPVDASIGNDQIEAQYAREDAVRGDSLESVKAQIDAIEVQRAYDWLVMRLQNLLEQAPRSDKAES